MTLVLLLLSACTAPNHLGNPLTFPIHGVATGFENAAYNHDRRQVKAWVAEHAKALRAEQFKGPVTDELLATLPAKNREKVRGELRQIAKHPDFVEQATVIVMVHR